MRRTGDFAPWLGAVKAAEFPFCWRKSRVTHLLTRRALNGRFCVHDLPQWNPWKFFSLVYKLSHALDFYIKISTKSIDHCIFFIDGVHQTSMGSRTLTKHAWTTAEFIKLYDKLLNTWNRHAKGDKLNPFRIPFTINSFRHQFLRKSKGELHRMRFVDKMAKKPVTTLPCLENLKFIINSYLLLWKNFKIWASNYWTSVR